MFCFFVFFISEFHRVSELECFTNDKNEFCGLLRLCTCLENQTGYANLAVNLKLLVESLNCSSIFEQC